MTRIPAPVTPMETILRDENEELREKIREQEKENARLRTRFQNVAAALRAVPGLPLDVYKLVR